MRIMFAVLVMGAIATFAAVLVAIQVVVSLLPWLVAALVVGAGLRWWAHHSRRLVTAPPPPSAPRAVARPSASAGPSPPRPVGWVMVAVPVWEWPPPDAARRHPGIVDAEVISEGDGRG